MAVTMGPDSAVRALHKAVSLGADRSLHLSDAGSRAPTSRRPVTRSPKTLEREAPTWCCSASSPTTASATRSARWSPSI